MESRNSKSAFQVSFQYTASRAGVEGRTFVAVATAVVAAVAVVVASAIPHLPAEIWGDDWQNGSFYLSLILYRWQHHG